MRQKSVGNPPPQTLYFPDLQTVQALLPQPGKGLQAGCLAPRSPGHRPAGEPHGVSVPPSRAASRVLGAPGSSASPTLHPLCPERRSPTRRTGPGPEGRARHLMSGLGATHLENRQRPNFRLSPASLRCPHGILLKSICQRENPFLPKWLVHCLAVTEELVRQMNHGHKVGCIEQNGCRTRAHWRSWILQDGSRTATGSQKSSQVSEHKPLAG